MRKPWDSEERKGRVRMSIDIMWFLWDRNAGHMRINGCKETADDIINEHYRLVSTL